MSISDDDFYMDFAYLTAKRSHDKIYRVGCVVVKDRMILAEGYNGVPSGMEHITRTDGVTRPEVIHSEANALMKMVRNGVSSDGATIYCTYSPCFECAKLILQAGITRIVYANVYREDSIKFLIERGFNEESSTKYKRILRKSSHR